MFLRAEVGLLIMRVDGAVEHLVLQGVGCRLPHWDRLCAHGTAPVALFIG